jgi:hypothetical protein
MASITDPERNGVPGELVVRVRPVKVIAVLDATA